MGNELPFWRRITEALRRIFAMSSGRHLCDTCKYDYGTVCSRPERTNALQCPDYKHK